VLRGGLLGSEVAGVCGETMNMRECVN